MVALKKRIGEFVLKYGFYYRPVKLARIEKIIEEQGFKIIYFYPGELSTEIQNLLAEKDMLEFAAQKYAFSYIDNDTKAVFICEYLSDDEKLYLLLHEESHIFCKHHENNIDLTDVKKEIEANRFADGVMEYRKKIIKKAAYAAIVLSLTLALINTSQPFRSMVDNLTPETTTIITTTAPQAEHSEIDVYITPSGKKYHKSTCQHVENKSNTSKTTIEMATALGYTPCDVCFK